jgi:hypothetical protein
MTARTNPLRIATAVGAGRSAASRAAGTFSGAAGVLAARRHRLSRRRRLRLALGLRCQGAARARRPAPARHPLPSYRPRFA